MRLLIVKMSSLGDVIHTLPALTDAGRAFPDITFDWVVEENFADIPACHPLVNKVIPIALRRWRKNLMSRKTWQEWRAFRHHLRATSYDLIIDAQGLLKSTLIAFQANGTRVGFDRHSAREPLAAAFYHKAFRVAKKQHAIPRLRHLFSQALGYPPPVSPIDYGLDRSRWASNNEENYLVFLHGTTWDTKHWPESAWIELAKIATDQGFTVKLAWGNKAEQDRAHRIAATSPGINVLPRQGLMGMASVLAGAKAVVGVDTGLLHLSAALNVPAVSLYGPTHPGLSGAVGPLQKHLTVTFSCSPCLSRKCTYKSSHSPSPVNPPCFATLPPLLVWKELMALLAQQEREVRGDAPDVLIHDS